MQILAEIPRDIWVVVAFVAALILVAMMSPRCQRGLEDAWP